MRRCMLLIAVIAMWTGVVWAQAPAFGLNNTTFVVRLLSPLNTKTARVGDTFTASVEEPSQFQGGVMQGSITKLKRPKRGGGKGKAAEVRFQFETLTFNNSTEKISADLTEVKNSKGVSNVDEEGQAIGVSSKKKAIGAGVAGGVLGGVLGGLRGGASGAAEGAAIGTAAGLAIGLTMTTQASDIEFQPGSLFTLTVSDSK